MIDNPHPESFNYSRFSIEIFHIVRWFEIFLHEFHGRFL